MTATRPDNSVLRFDYDNNGNLTVLTNPRNIDHSFDYNGVDAQSSYSTPSSGSYRYLYDKDRRLIEAVSPSGLRASNFYNESQLDYTLTPEGQIDYEYLCATKLGSVSMGSEKISYGYDGKLVTSETLTGTLNQSLSYAYNNDFNLETFTYAGNSVSYGFDNDGLLTQAGRFTINRNSGNGLPEQVSDTASALTRSFNGYGEIDGESLRVAGLQRFDYAVSSRDSAGRALTKTETVDGVAVNYGYTYDSMGRLTAVTKNGSLVEEYRYDDNGRREYEMNLSRGIAGRNYSYNDEDQLQTAGSVVYQHDLDGFLTSKTENGETTRYDYSSRGELLSVALPDGTLISYDNDPIGRRIAKKVNGVIVEKYLWQGLARLLAILDGNDNIKMRFEYADSRMPISMIQSGTTYYLGYDQVGSLRVVLDTAGGIVKEVSYDSFGNVLNDSNETMWIPFGFAGGLYDLDASLIRFGLRDYDPDTGGWTAKDPLGFNGGNVNLVNYVQSDPVNWTDPFGLFVMGLAGSANIGIGGVVDGQAGFVVDDSLDFAGIGSISTTAGPQFAGSLGGALIVAPLADSVSDLAGPSVEGHLRLLWVDLSLSVPLNLSGDGDILNWRNFVIGLDLSPIGIPELGVGLGASATKIIDDPCD